MLTGSLFRFKAPTWPAPLQAFESPAVHAHRNFCVYLGGLTDGLLACAYVESLASELDRRGWALVQPVLSSAYSQYGRGSLSRDAEEVAELFSFLERNRGNVCNFAIVGHSTGCQDAVTLLERGPVAVRRRLRAAVLQAPVSDREAHSLEGDDGGVLSTAESMVAAGDGHKLIHDFLHYGFVPMTASRYVSLFGRGGPDDMFSSDHSDDYLAARLGHMGTRGQRSGRPAMPELNLDAIEPVPDHPGLRTLFVHSGGDEYVPKTVDVSALSNRFVTAAGGAENGAEALIIDRATHNLAEPPPAAPEFVKRVGTVLGEVSGVGAVVTPS